MVLPWLGFGLIAFGAWQMTHGHTDQWWLVLAGFAVIGLDVVIDLWIANPLTSLTDEPALNRRGEQYIGRTATLIEPIVAGRGKISLDDTHWVVEGPDMALGERVKIIETRGPVLVVCRVAETDASTNS